MTFSTQSCQVLHSFWASLLFSFILWFTVLSLRIISLRLNIFDPYGSYIRLIEDIQFLLWGFTFIAMLKSSSMQSRQFVTWTIHTFVLFLFFVLFCFCLFLFVFFHFCFLVFVVFLFVFMLPWQLLDMFLLLFPPFQVFHTSISLWFLSGVWVTTSLLKSPGHFSVFWWLYQEHHSQLVSPSFSCSTVFSIPKQVRGTYFSFSFLSVLLRFCM